MNITHRLYVLATRKLEWEDPVSGTSTITREDWSTCWQIAGWPSSNWWWVRKYGKMECGCTRNPVTRHRVLIAMHCPIHGAADWWFDEDDFV